MGLRREARELAIQTLYAIHFDCEDSSKNSTEISKLINEKISQVIAFQNKKFPDSQKEFIHLLVQKTYKNLDAIDNLIKQFSKHWDFKRISIMDKIILQMAIMEMEFTDTPPKIIINEAIEIAKKFCGEKSGKFINGISDAVMHRKDYNDKM